MQTHMFGTGPRTKAQIMSGVVAEKAKLTARNTVEYTRANGERVLRFHLTDIVTWSADGRCVTLDSGGYRTLTTKERINDALPGGIRLGQDRGVWWLRQGDRRVPFYDGIVIRDGELPRANTKGSTKELRRIETWQKRINAFVRPLLDPTKPLPVPSSGDCWFCALRDDQGRTMGEHGSDSDHLASHIKEGYLHGSLVVNALRHAGVSDMGIALYLRDASASGRRLIAGRVRRYLKAKLALVAR